MGVSLQQKIILSPGTDMLDSLKILKLGDDINS